MTDSKIDALAAQERPADSPQARSQVAVADCQSYAPELVRAALAELMQTLGGLSTFIKAGQTVLIKPNLFGLHPPEHAVTTHPEIVRQVVELCFQSGAARVWVGDSPVGMQSEPKLWSITGMTAAVAGTAAELKSWHVPQAGRPCGDETLAVPQWYDEVDAVISLPKLKTHNLTTLTCGLKNVYGLINGPAKAQFHVRYPSPLAMSGFLVRVFGALKPRLTIADAVVAMEGNGPAHGQPVPVGVLLASADTVALDAIACTALRIAPEQVPMIRLAAAAGLGQTDAARIECVGSGRARLKSAAMKPSFARFLERIPEICFALAPRLARLRPVIKKALCSKCGTCIATCPRRAIAANAADHFPVIDRALCIDCFCCLESCPKGAIAAQFCVANLIGLSPRMRKDIAS